MTDKKIPLREGAPIPAMVRINDQGVVKKGAQIPSMQPVPSSRPSPGGSSSGGQQPSGGGSSGQSGGSGSGSGGKK